MNQLFPNAKKIFCFNTENNLSTFKTVNPVGHKNFIGRKDQLKIRPERKMKLDILKSHTKLYTINTKFLITERGLDCSQKTSNTHFISVGRQQVNDQGVRPNDIMLFPTDPSISRSHFKIFHKEYFEKQKSFDDTLMTMCKLTRSSSNSRFSCNKNDILNIMKYIYPKKNVAIEDNGTIYGTYVRVKSFKFPAFMENFLLTMKNSKFSNGLEEESKTAMDKIISLGGPQNLNNFSLIKTLDIFSTYEFDGKEINSNLKFNSEKEELFEFLYSKRNEMELIFNENFIYENDYDRRIHNSYLNYLQCHIPRNCLEREISDRQIILENNFSVNYLLPAVFLNNSKNGFNIIEIGNMSEIVEALRNEYLSFNGEFYPTVELISFDKIFECQKLDPSSQVYKAQVTKEELVYIYQFNPLLPEYSILLLIETLGDPCGVMNRVNDVLFFSHKSGRTDNRRVFSFNYLKGYLIGNNPESSLHINSDVDAFLYYNTQVDKWMLTDLTKFLNPVIYYSEDYYGLWVCISSDKKANHRYSSEIFYVKSEDEIKISETIMKLRIEDK
jgi:hypothetical protein